MGKYYKVHGVPGYSNGKHVRRVDYFEIEDDGTLVFYVVPDHHDGEGVKLGDVAEPEGRAVEAFKKWAWVEEKE